MQKGILNYEQRSEKTLVFFRSIENANEIDFADKRQLELSKKFFDMKKNYRDSECQLLIEELKTKITKKLDPNNICLLPQVHTCKQILLTWIKLVKS